MNNQNNNTPSSSVDVKSSNNGKASTTSITEKKKTTRHNRNTLKKKPTTSSPSSLNGSTYSQGASANNGTTPTTTTTTTNSTSSTMTFSAQQVSPSSSPPTPSKVIFFRRIPADTTQSDLKALCQPFGAVTNILLLKNGQALVQFAYLDEAIDFIEAYNQDPPSFVIRDTRVIPSYSSHNELSKGSISKSDSNSNQTTNNGKQQEPNHILLVTISKSKASDVTIDALNELFSIDGTCPIQKIVMFNKTAGLQALIQYSNVDDAVEARKRLQGATPFSPQDQLLIQFSNLKDLTVHQNSDKARDYTKQSSSTSTPPSVATPSASSPTTNVVTATTTSTPSIMKRVVVATGTSSNNNNSTAINTNKPSTTPTTTTSSTSATVGSPPSQQPIVQPLQQDPRSRSNSASSGVFEHHQVIQPQHGIPQTSPTISSFMNNIPSTAINAPSNVPTTNTPNRVPIAHLSDNNNANLISSSIFSYGPFSHRDSFAFSSNIPSSQHSHHHHLSHPSSGHNPSSSSSHHHTHNHHQTNSVQNQFLNPSFLASHQQTTHPLGHHQPFTADNLIMPSNGVMVLPQNGSQTSNSAPNSATQYRLLNNGFSQMTRSNPSTPSNPNPKNPNNAINGIISAPSSSLLPTDNNAGTLRLNVNIPPSSSSNPSNTPSSSATLGTIGSNIPSSRLLSTPNTQTNTHSPTEEKEDTTEQEEEEEVIDENDLESKDPNSEKSSVLLVSNFNDKIVNCDLLFNLFSCYGYIYRIKIFKTKPDHALVQMASHKQALNAINSLKGLQIFGKTLSVNFSKHTFINSSKSDSNMKDFTKTNLNRFPRNLSTSPSSNSPTTGKQHKLYMCQPTQTLHISNVPFEKDDKGREILTNIFSKFGEIEGLRVFRHNDKPMALIKFKTVTAAAEALASLHNETVSGKHMKVAFSLNTVVTQNNNKKQ